MIVFVTSVPKKKVPDVCAILGESFQNEGQGSFMYVSDMMQ